MSSPATPPERSFPRHSARTQGFTLGAPRNATVAPDGGTVLFLRSAGGTDRRNALWMLDTRSGAEQCLADPLTLQGEETVSAEEQARRERARERAAGITGYATDRAVRTAAFTLSGQLFLADLTTGTVRELPAQSPVADPRPDPGGRHIAYTSRGQLRVIGVDGSGDRALAEPEHERVQWGVAEFIAAEEMGRSRGYWWSPDGTMLLAARVDETPVQQWYLADPTHPAQPPTTMPYPAAGTANAEVTLALIGLDAHRTDVSWDREAFPYLVTVHWSPHGAPLLAVQTRDQHTQLVLALDPGSGQTRELHRDTDPHWVEIRPGWPAWTPDGQLVRVDAREGAYRLVVGDRDRTGDDVQVRAILDIGDEDILLSASERDPAQVHVYRAGPHGIERLSTGAGVHTATRSGATMVLSSSGLEEPGTRMRVLEGTRRIAEIGSRADTPTLGLNVELLWAGERELRSALLLPSGYRPEHGRLPVLLDPYGGPQAQRVLARQYGYLTSQWFADQGFAVVITDGRGMAGRTPEWDRAIAGDLAGPPLDDQVEALHAIAAERSELDLGRVAIRGWSFGGYLAALAVLRRPDVFHAAIAGAAVCDWRLYDTHYTERYLGDPADVPEVYESNSLIGTAAQLERPMLIVHGTVDDNVVPAHSLRLSAALTAASRPHTLLPLPGVSHVPTEETTAENLLLLQLDFLHRALGDAHGGREPA
ncbi:dipeptidyl-peptidase-4 [Halopolyspora algeriensis]|uniref:Dipeptidyl-peptidase-4 n=1 Tax=Halopolyspora algeriensis TaxID=1500506 RepID=A0A368VS40_9ACTN|nr:prolyl oligopeptidase family serine peptidase [Halopolyspora algeriensis]RCW44710.1 dipeptidyl-peptidase-4 [Halopolyspora algeriensis]TQM56067.1 dipeptidyl-peptidase-4 [Halopolyspora algeriensis]